MNQNNNDNFFLRHKKFIYVIIKVLFTFGIFYYIFSFISVTSLFSLFHNINIFYLSLASLLLILNLFLQYKKWHILLKNRYSDLNNLNIFKSLLSGLAGGLITPLRLGEYFSRKIYLDEIKIRSIIILTLIDNIFSLYVISLLGCLSSIILIYFYFEISILISLSVLVIIIFIYYFIFQLMLSKSFFDYLSNNRLISISKFKPIKSFFEELSYLKININLKLLTISTVHFIVIVLQFSFLIMTFDSSTNFFYNLLSSVMVMFSKTFIPSLTISDLGIREFSAVYFFGLFNVSKDVALVASLSLFFMNLIIPSVIGLYFIYKKN